MSLQAQGQRTVGIFAEIGSVHQLPPELQLDFDPSCQIIAIRMLLERQEAHEEERDKTIQRLKESHCDYEAARLYGEGKYIEMCGASIYEDAAHSMAAVGMMAPLLETVFAQCFHAFGQKYGQVLAKNNSHERLKKPNKKTWDCHCVLDGKSWSDNLVQGILQLSNATGLREHLPQNIDKVLAALFAYRNKMFHCGFEWPVAERESFARRIVDEGWPTEWFQRASHDEQPWIFYMSHAFVDECQMTFEKVIGAFCELVKQKGSA